MLPYSRHQRLLTQWGTLLAVLLVVAVDLIVRHQAIFAPESGRLFFWTKAYLGFYLLSAILGLCLLILFRTILQWFATLHQRLGTILTLLFIAVWAMICVASWEYYRYFSMIPTLYTFQFMSLEPGETVTTILSALTWPMLLETMALAIGLYFFFGISVKRYHVQGWCFRLPFFLSLGISVIFWGILNNNIRFIDQCLTPDVNAFVTAIKIKLDPKASDYFNRTGLHAGNRTPLTPLSQPVSHPTIVIINESLRRRELPFYGYTRPTMPFLLTRMASQPDDYFIFKQAYGNAATTIIAYPTVIAGGSAVTTGRVLHTLPLLWDYGKAAGCFTVCISSHIYDWRNFLTFIKSPSLDRLWCQEISGIPPIDSRYFGIDDRYTVDHFLSILDEARRTGKPFFGVLHLFDTHFPYYSPDSLKKFDGPQGEYDNSILYLDLNLERLFQGLEQRGIWDSTLIAFTSDHGEAFNEHGVNGHITNLFVETISVPFWFRIPKALQQGHSLDTFKVNRTAAVYNADLAPTIADLLGLGNEPDIQSIWEQGGGQSLLKAIPKERPLILTNSTEYSVNRDNHFLVLVRDHLYFTAFVEGGRAILGLFDLRTDPDCYHNLWPSTPLQEKKAIKEALLKHTNTRLILEKTSIGNAFF